ncbi:MAG: (2Fe-2S) ferredoxin domain-containing protein [Clostridia bacterium]|nr:(2Fe-2S) ferredoxin domain-containing protein [Clostridia bacterium]
MKSIEDLMAIRQQTLSKIQLQNPGDEFRIVVGLATCGIAVGARPVLDAFAEGIAADKSLSKKVSVTQTGCIGVCQYEPVVEVYEKGKEKVTYVKVNAEKAKEIIEKHIKGGEIVTDYTIGNVIQ